MHLSDYDFDLPAGLIAQAPVVERTASRLMILSGVDSLKTGSFADLAAYLRPGDLLVLNDTRVIPARLLGHKATGGRIEVFLARRLPGVPEIWDCLTRCSKTPKSGQRLLFSGGLEGEVLDGGEPTLRRIRFTAAGDVATALEQVGQMPLPPYIERPATTDDRERYQTVFARNAGALAAPTAGLHFSVEFLQHLQTIGVEVATLTLHVGLGTFLPVRDDDLSRHRMHAEDYVIPSETAAAVNRARQQGRRVIAVGTTVTRTLEAACDPADGTVRPGSGSTDIFIAPGFCFQAVDGLLTNFHLPRSTLLLLVAAFAGRERILAAYARAVRERFRFYSYGDCMLILPSAADPDQVTISG
jgi:S-adenosylmethionine:tRNA ribosyltransferase-isomerase